VKKVLIANRGEVAIRIARAVAELGLESVAVYPDDDARSLHVRRADEAVRLSGRGVAAYLDVEQIVAVAQAAGCSLVHPGYGFLSESARFARACEAAGLIFVGPRAETLDLFGDKTRARSFAQRCDVPVIPGSDGSVTLEQARAFFDELGDGVGMMIKAVAGGGGRGMRAVSRAQDVEESYARCQSEALAAFGLADVYVERLVQGARHIEVQVVGDGSGQTSHLWERDCTLQRRHQKLVEIAPSPALAPALRSRLLEAAVRMARTARYAGVGTFEFLVELGSGEREPFFAFIEANPRLQVEHTVTEMITEVDLVQTQLRLALGARLVQLNLEQAAIAPPRGYAIQVRVNTESLSTDGVSLPTGGTLEVFEAPAGPGVRVDTYGYAGYTVNPSFDSLLAKLIAYNTSGSFADVIARCRRALTEFRIEGVRTNISLLHALLRHPAVISQRVSTRFIEEHVGELTAASDADLPRLYFGTDEISANTGWDGGILGGGIPDGFEAVVSPMHATVVSVDVREGDLVEAGHQVAVLEAMKMEHAVLAPQGGTVRRVLIEKGNVVPTGQALIFLEPNGEQGAATLIDVAPDLEQIRPDLAEARRRHEIGSDSGRPQAVAKRHNVRRRTARENLADLIDSDSFIEYGALAIAAQRSRHTLDDLIRNTPADGVITGIASVNGREFDAEHSRCAVLAYDYTVLAGTQGVVGHHKTDRLLRLARRWRLPVVIFAEGGGGRPGDVDYAERTLLDTATFAEYARLSALVPLVGVVSGRCFAGNAALLGCSDVIIATPEASIGMGGPAMIEGGGLGKFHADEIGPVSTLAANGVIDIVAANEAEAVRAAKQYLAYFQGPVAQWRCADQRQMRHVIPESRSRTYDVRAVIQTLADEGSVLELRKAFGTGIVTAFVRIEGRPFGLLANDCRHLGGAIDAPAADKGARFLQLCDAFDLPVISLIDTPGFMVGPESEKQAAVRRFSRLFVIAASMTVPLFSVVLRKAYGLGANSVTGGGFHEPFFTVSWPTGEFGTMGLEGSVRLGFRRELERITDPAERAALFAKLLAREQDKGKALNVATYLEVDDVIDPADTRRWILRGIHSVPPLKRRDEKKRPCVDTW
jgi:acetyl/propionyl-CoA carboxylase alpha subunit/acetyl-CoA carboxylase carboxyltransferase component